MGHVHVIVGHTGLSTERAAEASIVGLGLKIFHGCAIPAGLAQLRWDSQLYFHFRALSTAAMSNIQTES